MQALTAGKVKGIDVSHHNGTITWSKVKGAGYQFTYVKCTESTNFTDNMFITNAKSAKAAGLHVGAYHFARPSGSAADGTAEAKYFVSMLQKVDTDLLPCLDLEASTLTSATLISAWVDAFAAYVKQTTGKAILLYTGLWFMDKYPGLSAKLAKYPLWVSYYKTSAPPNNGWKAWTAWQYSDKGTVPGISGGVDINVAVSLDSILANKKAPTPAATTTVKPDMYDLSYLKDNGFVDVISSAYHDKVLDKVTWTMNAKADCVLLTKRGFDIRKLQAALNKMYPPE